MFETVLKERLERIFDIGKVTYDSPSSSRDQQALFVDVKTVHSKVRDKREIARVDGQIQVFANSEKMPMDYFSKRIAAAAPADTKDLFFGPVQNVGVIRNIAERKFDFTFLFDSQYDPNLGSLTSIDLSFEET